MTGSSVAVEEIGTFGIPAEDRARPAAGAEPSRGSFGTLYRSSFIAVIVVVQLAWLAVLAYGIQLLA